MIYTYKIIITGIVQGVGFRPHVYRCAQFHSIKGSVFNNSEGVVIYAQGQNYKIESFLTYIRTKAPVLSRIDKISCELITDKSEYVEFTIDYSGKSVDKNLVIPPDACVCDECLQELFNPNDRRFLYPFINCIHCGPRYSIISDVPYDRQNTTMQDFQMCNECLDEYKNSLDRRFHAQPNACSKCGPNIKLYNNKGEEITSNNIINEVISLLKQGNILAVKGLGGYHLMVDPYNYDALSKLRERKKREQKPFALVFETLDECRKFCDLTSYEEKLLLSVERPIVLVKKSKDQHLPELIAPHNDNYGVMLAYTPLQHLILRGSFACLVCTSANISDEPIIYKDELNKFKDVADFIVMHNREIHTFVDDSVVRAVNGYYKEEVQVIRRARGYTPKSLICKNNNRSILALGAELKNTVCLVKNENILIGQHIGDIKHLSTYHAFQDVILHIKKICNFVPEIIACDLHPNFLNTNYANNLNVPLVKVQHHYAHMCACMIENEFFGDVIGVIFDGMGYGTDGNIWGGEFLTGNYNEFIRVAHFEYFPLPGGDVCKRKISVAAYSCLLKAFRHKDAVIKNWNSALTHAEMELYEKMINLNINSPLTSSVGRIFDVVAAILGLCVNASYEGQAAIILEQQIGVMHYNLHDVYSFTINRHEKSHTISLHTTYMEILSDKNSMVPLEIISWKFHNTMVKIIHDMCLLISGNTQIKTVVLSGGCFQNKFLLESTIKALSNKGIKVLYHTLYPTNDGGISLGQAAHVIYGGINE